MEKENPTRLEAYMANVQSFVKDVLGAFNEYEFYTGDSVSDVGFIN